jgi:hypothetical protein
MRYAESTKTVATKVPPALALEIEKPQLKNCCQSAAMSAASIAGRKGSDGSRSRLVCLPSDTATASTVVQS